MVQKIKFEFDDNPGINANQLSTISTLATKFDMHDIRVTDDPTNIKVYVGPYYKEQYRYWIDESGLLSGILVEKDHAADTEDSDWQPIDWYDAHSELTGIPRVDIEQEVKALREQILNRKSRWNK